MKKSKENHYVRWSFNCHNNLNNHYFCFFDNRLSKKQDIFGSAITIVWLGTRYSAAKKGFAPGVNRQELQSIYQTMEKMQQDIEEIKATLADLVIQLHDRQ